MRFLNQQLFLTLSVKFGIKRIKSDEIKCKSVSYGLASIYDEQLVQKGGHVIRGQRYVKNWKLILKNRLELYVSRIWNVLQLIVNR